MIGDLLNNIHIVARGSKIKLFPGEFFQSVTIGLEHIDMLVHLLNLFFVLLDLPFLTFNLHTCLYPMYPGIAGTDNPNDNEHSSTERHEDSESAMFSLKYIAEPAQNTSD